MHLVGFTIEIYYDTRPYELQIYLNLFSLIFFKVNWRPRRALACKAVVNGEAVTP